MEMTKCHSPREEVHGAEWQVFGMANGAYALLMYRMFRFTVWSL
ncbi:hypothetical protein [Paraprevotella clara]|nr:hypothetical protein [Paraprevotella clara]